LLLHGLLGSTASWIPFANATGRWCIALDLPGFGESDPPRTPHLGAYADDVAEALAILHLPACTVIGHSLGGAVATSLAERAHDRVASLVLCAPAGFGRHLGAELAALPAVRQLAAGSLPRLLTSTRLRPVVRPTLVRCGLQPTLEVRRRLAAEIARVGPGAAMAVRALAGAGRSPAAFHRRSVGYRGPVTALWGENDPLIPREHAGALRRALPQVEVHVLSGVGHLLHRDRSHELARLLDEAPRAGIDRIETRCGERHHAGISAVGPLSTGCEISQPNPSPLRTQPGRRPGVSRASSRSRRDHRPRA
jgi:pyruvate dehydrogenase E2 component (dihydrolipoamide acetyltransferase)